MFEFHENKNLSAKVKLIGIDKQNRVKLSRVAAMDEEEKPKSKERTEQLHEGKRPENHTR